MQKFTIKDSIAAFKKEFDFVNGNWKGGPVSDSYKKYLSAMGDVLIATEKCLEQINEGYSKVSNAIEESDEFKTTGAKNMYGAGVEKHSAQKQDTNNKCKTR